MYGTPAIAAMSASSVASMIRLAQMT